MNISNSPWLSRSLKWKPKLIEKKDKDSTKSKDSKKSKNKPQSINMDTAKTHISYGKNKENIRKDNKSGPLSFGGGITAKQRRYRNVEYLRHGRGRHTVRRVYIVGGKGHKSVTTPKGTTKKPLSPDEIEKICKREFIPGLFDDCMAKHSK